MISYKTIESITGRLRISEVASDYFPVKKSGSAHKALCPFHAEKSPSLTLNDKRNSFKCFGCGAGGSIFRLIMRLDGLTFPDTVKKLGKRAGVEVEEENNEASIFRRGMERVLSDAEKAFQDFLFGKEGKLARQYLRERGFNGDISREWGVGYAPATYPLAGDSVHLVGSGMVFSDRGQSSLRFKDRIMFSIRDSSGKIVGFSGRTMVDHHAKYLNTPETPLFRKGNLLYGLDKASRPAIEKGELVLVEGQIDVIKCHLAGITNTVAPLGTAFTEAQARIVRRLCGKAVIILDGDKAGQEAARKVFCGLSPLGIDVRSVVLPDNQDPDQYLQAGNDLSKAIESSKCYIEQLVESMVGSLDSAKARANAAKTIGFLLSKIDDSIIQDAMVVKIAPKMGVGPAELKKHIAISMVDLHGGPKMTRENIQKCILSEAERLAVAWLLHKGKGSQDWSVIDNPAIREIVSSDFEPGNEGAIALVLSRLDPLYEAAWHSTEPAELDSISLDSLYRSMVKMELTRIDSLVSSGQADIMSLKPLLDILNKSEE